MTDVLDPADRAIAAPARPAADPGSGPSRRRSSGVLGWIAIGLLAVAFAAVIAAVAVSSTGPDALAVVVPAGTAERLDAGGVVEEIDRVVHLEPGQALELENDDGRLHVIGTLRADAGESTRQVFTSEGRYVLTTSLRSDGIVTVLVEQPDAG